MSNLLFNALLQATGFGVAGLGLVIAFRIVRFPDLTGDGSFILGGAVFAVSVQAGVPWIVAIIAATLSGALAGIFTSVINLKFGVSRLLCGILTSMVAYSISFRLLNGRSNVGLDSETIREALDWMPRSFFDEDVAILVVSAILAVGVALFVLRVLKSELGLLLRTSGDNALLVSDLGHSPSAYQTIGLALANGLVSFSATIVSMQQGFVDLNLGLGIVITLVASLVIGEEIIRRLWHRDRLGAGLAGRVAGPFIGAFAYFLLFLLLVRGSIEGWVPIAMQPTDLKMLAAVLVISVIALRRITGEREQVFPL